MPRPFAAAALLACMTAPVVAAPILFDNTDGAFAWTPGYFILFGQGGATTGSPGAQELDVTLPPTQPGTPGDPFELGDDHTFNYLKVVWSDPVIGGVYNADQIGHGLDSRFAIGEVVGVDTVAGPIAFWLPRPFEVGEVVGPDEAYIDQVSPMLAVSTSVIGEWAPLGEQVFVGVRFVLHHEDAEPTTHFGWIEMVAKTVTVDGEDFIERFVPARWAYETSPDTPIVVNPDIPPNCGPDLSGDGAIDSKDLNALLQAFGSRSGGDIDGDGDTDSSDLNLLLASFGTGCS